MALDPMEHALIFWQQWNLRSGDVDGQLRPLGLARPGALCGSDGDGACQVGRPRLTSTGVCFQEVLRPFVSVRVYCNWRAFEGRARMLHKRRPVGRGQLQRV